MRPILVLGASGMLGQGVLQAFKGYRGPVQATVREAAQFAYDAEVDVMEFDVSKDSLHDMAGRIAQGTLIVNCIGIIKPYIHDDNQTERNAAVRINGLFPYDLARFAEADGHEIIQIATDCVYSGKKGQYTESDELDALDVYGKSKALGEVPSSSMMHIRVSIIGPETGRSTSLFEWVKNQPANGEIGGFTDHLWNGVTTYHFGKIVRGIAETGAFKSGVFHLIPGNVVTKESLVKSIAGKAGRGDLTIIPRESGTPIDRTLSSDFRDVSDRLWQAAGYSKAPTVEDMISELP